MTIALIVRAEKERMSSMTSLQLIVTTRQQMARIAPAVAMVSVAVLASTITVSAQQAARGFVTLNGGYQATSTDFTDNIVFTKFVEEGDLDADYGLGGGPLLDMGGGVRLWRNLAVGVAVSAFGKDDDAGVTARVPHPFFFDRDRQISGSQAGMRREETAVHVQAIWIVPVNGALEVSVFGGPTFFDITQDLVTGVLFTQAYPFDTATFTGTTTGRQSASKVGFNVGADVSVYFFGHIGVGWLARFSRATIDLPSQDGGTVAVETGGFQTGGGLRLRF